MHRLLIFLSLATVCLAYDLHLKIAEKLAVPHYNRHSYEYPHINLGAIMAQANRGPSFNQPAPLSQPAPASAPASGSRPSSFEQPSSISGPSSFEEPSGFSRPSTFRQSSSFGRPSSSQGARQTRFFNMYAPNLAADLGSQFGRRQS